MTRVLTRFRVNPEGHDMQSSYAASPVADHMPLTGYPDASGGAAAYVAHYYRRVLQPAIAGIQDPDDLGNFLNIQVMEWELGRDQPHAQAIIDLLTKAEEMCWLASGAHDD